MRTLRALSLATLASLFAALLWPHVHTWVSAPQESAINPATANDDPPASPLADDAAPASPPLVQVAILLDTSSSMDGLIHQARSQLWRVVNELDGATREGQAPRLELAVYEYGNSGLDPGVGYLRQVTPFSTELDLVSEALFGLSTMGGDEYCGQVLATSLRELEWSDRPGALRLVYIAGNESFGQGPVDFHRSVADAREAGILVNTVHCGSEGPEIDAEWARAATLGGGRSVTIDAEAVARYVAAPQDEAIARLGVELNATYLYYGAAGGHGAANQAAQDANASSLGGGSMVQRSMSKASGYYDNARWDLVDGLDRGAVELAEIDADELPPELRGRSAESIAAVVADKKAERSRLQARIRELAAAREEWLAGQSGSAQPSTLDQAMIDTLHEQAAALGFAFAGRKA